MWTKFQLVNLHGSKLYVLFFKDAVKILVPVTVAERDHFVLMVNLSIIRGYGKRIYCSHV